jgi:hypothetical protein
VGSVGVSTEACDLPWTPPKTFITVLAVSALIATSAVARTAIIGCCDAPLESEKGQSEAGIAPLGGGAGSGRQPSRADEGDGERRLPTLPSSREVPRSCTLAGRPKGCRCV